MDFHPLEGTQVEAHDFHGLSFLFETGSHMLQASLRLPIKLRMALNF